LWTPPRYIGPLGEDTALATGGGGGGGGWVWCGVGCGGGETGGGEKVSSLAKGSSKDIEPIKRTLGLLERTVSDLGARTLRGEQSARCKILKNRGEGG